MHAVGAISDLDDRERAASISMMVKPACSLLITDLDNTLWNWVEIWRRSFGALLAETMRISGLSQEALETDMKMVHRKHGTAEYAFVLEELPCLQALHPGQDLRVVYKQALDARRAARNEACVLYDGVRETIEQVRAAGAPVVAFTDSMSFYTSDRLRRTGLDDVIDVLYSAPDHDLPAGLTQKQLRRHPKAHYEHRLTVHRHTPKGALKPNAAILRRIISEMGGDVASTVYVGDAPLKDLAMAQDAGVLDIWAKYGESRTKEGYSQLVRVTHWTDQDVARELALKERDVTASLTLHDFRELSDLVVFRTPSPQA